MALQSQELIYYELDGFGDLKELGRIELEAEVVCMDIGDIPEGRQRCKFMAVGLSNHKVRVFSLDLDSCLQKISFLDLPSVSESVSLIEMSKDAATHFDTNYEQVLYLFVGMKNGVLLKAKLNQDTCNLSDIRTRVLGNRPVRYFFNPQFIF